VRGVKRTVLIALFLVLSGMLAAKRCFALINPDYTPVHLVKDSSTITLVKFDGKVTGGKATARVERNVKGKFAGKTITIDLNRTALKDHAAWFKEWIEKLHDEPSLLFVGSFWEDSGDIVEEEAIPRAYLHINSRWVLLDPVKGNAFEFVEFSDVMLATWFSGTDMLLRCVEYCIKDRDADLRFAAGGEWKDYARVVQIEKGARVGDIRAVALDGSGTPRCFVTCDRGDRLLEYSVKRRELMEDVTAKRGLKSKSAEAVWGDLDADGRLDLLSWDGKVLRRFLQGKEGKFGEGSAIALDGSIEECIGLHLIDSGVKNVPAILVSTSGSPRVFLPAAGARMKMVKLAENDAEVKKWGNSAPCLVADFDGDGEPDIIQMFLKGSRFFKGKGQGAFAAPRKLEIELGIARKDEAYGIEPVSRPGAFVGDFDTDGRFDIMAFGEKTLKFFYNCSKLEFRDRLFEAGQFSYLTKPYAGVTGGTAADFNNDSHQDVLLVYDVRTPQLYFNRGFTSFGLAHLLDVDENELLPAAQDGLKAGCLGDFSGDGRQDMVLALNNSEIWAFIQEEVEKENVLRVAVPLTGLSCGPVKVWAWHGERMLGAWNVVPGMSEARFGIDKPGMIKVQWAGSKEKMVVQLEGKPKRVVLPVEK